MPVDSGCGDPACDACHPPRQRCAACGALHAEPHVPFCSLGCALDGPPSGAPGGGALDRAAAAERRSTP